MSGEHTPTLWLWDQGDIGHDYSNPYCDVYTDDDLIIARVNDAFSKETGAANAARIAACVNAFHDPSRSIPTEQIQEGLVWKLYDALKRSDDKLRVFIAEHSDPGADALALLSCNEQILDSLKVQTDD